MHKRNSHFFNMYVFRGCCCCYYYYYVTRSNEHEISIFYRSSSYMLASASASSSSCSMPVLIYIIHLVLPHSPPLCVFAYLCKMLLKIVVAVLMLFCFFFLFFFWQVKFECMKSKISNHFLVSFCRVKARAVRVVAIQKHTVPIHGLRPHLLLYYSILFSLCSLPKRNFNLQIHTYSTTATTTAITTATIQPHRALGDIRSHLHIIFGI